MSPVGKSGPAYVGCVYLYLTLIAQKDRRGRSCFLRTEPSSFAPTVLLFKVAVSCRQHLVMGNNVSGISTLQRGQQQGFQRLRNSQKASSCAVVLKNSSRFRLQEARARCFLCCRVEDYKERYQQEMMTDWDKDQTTSPAAAQ
ncbi:unnamed protein product [Pleuronectes platessa]|uniref:Uncharacterized protein n=1 Tax=Pleuronectes platessa TaxID=8262 RepID=A0A9N7YX61_PLEPL|nr:unnamed protein product [Pleuronectes platessa]